MDKPAPPRDFDSLRADLTARAGSLSKRLTQVAQVFLNHPEEVAVTTLVRLADQAQVPPATITRFAKELGFAGFADLQLVFRERLLGPRLPYAERMAQPGIADADLDQPGHVFGSFVQAAVQSLLRIEEALDRDALDAFVEVLAQSEVIHVAAARGAFGLGAYAVYGLGSIGRRTHLIDNLGAWPTQFSNRPAPALLVMTFDDYRPRPVETPPRRRPGLRVSRSPHALSPVAPLASHSSTSRIAAGPFPQPGPRDLGAIR